MSAGGLAELASLLVARGTLDPAAAVSAERRAQLYGGGLDTVLIEMGLADERDITTALAEVMGLDPAPIHRLHEPLPDAAAVLDAATARRLGALPLLLDRAGALVELAVRPGADFPGIVGWAGAQGVEPVLFVMSEPRFWAVLALSYGEALPPRFGALLGRLDQGDLLRRRIAALAVPAPAPAAVARIESGSTAVKVTASVANDSVDVDISVEDIAAPAAATVPRAEPDREGLHRQVADADPATAVSAMRALAGLRDASAVPLLIDRVAARPPEVSAAAQLALAAITRQDFGASRRKWRAWWRRQAGQTRLDWLFQALAHQRPELRLAAEEEVRALTDVYAGYHFDLDERDREMARQRWRLRVQPGRGSEATGLPARPATGREGRA